MKEKLFMGVDYAYGSKKSNPFDISDLKKTLIEVRNGGMITPALNKIQSKINEGLKGVADEIIDEINKISMEERDIDQAIGAEDVAIKSTNKVRDIISKYIKNGYGKRDKNRLSKMRRGNSS